MSSDGIIEMPYSNLRKKLEELGFSDNPEGWEGDANTRTFRRDMMGLGTPHYVTIKYDSDAATVYPPTIRHLLKSLQIEVSAFLEA
jgi:hypothetical protein